jgi:zinc protease
LVIEKEWATEISAFVLGSHDPGLLIISGKLKNPALMPELESELRLILAQLVANGIQEQELTKVKNKFLTAKHFEELSIYSRALNLATFELFGDVEFINRETAVYQNITSQEIHTVAAKVLNFDHCSLLTILPESHDQ